MALTIVSPAPAASFAISAAPAWPSLPIRSDGAGPHLWRWRIGWRNFSRSGTANTAGNEWDAAAVLANLGGTLAVTAIAGGEQAAVTVSLVGSNPTAADVAAYVLRNPDGNGFDRILTHESRMRHFGTNGEPIRSFDGGYGLAQLTNPPPSYEQVWNWQLNVDGGIALFRQKVSAARNYLSQHGRSFTADQLRYEAVCRWNGGSYHVWDSAANAWRRNPDLLCDAATGNIGWDMTDPENQGKTAAALHERDKAGYSAPPGSGDHWRYSGVCYADAVLG